MKLKRCASKQTWPNLEYTHITLSDNSRHYSLCIILQDGSSLLLTNIHSTMGWDPNVLVQCAAVNIKKKKVLEMFSFGLHMCVKLNKHAVQCTLKFY